MDVEGGREEQRGERDGLGAADELAGGVRFIIAVMAGKGVLSYLAAGNWSCVSLTRYVNHETVISLYNGEDGRYPDEDIYGNKIMSENSRC